MTMPAAHTKRQRTCISCGTTTDKVTLMRIVRTPQGQLIFDPTGKAAGRGAYVCSSECFAAAMKKKKLDRALKTTLGSDDYERIAACVASYEREVRE